MDVITIESSAFNNLIDKINEIDVFIKKMSMESKKRQEQEIKQVQRERELRKKLEQEQELERKSKLSNTKFTYDDLCFEFDLSIKTLYRLGKNSLILSATERGRRIFKLDQIEKALGLKLITCTKEKEIEFRKKYNLDEY